MLDLYKQCILIPESKQPDLSKFSCGDEDLDEFFLKDASLFAKNLLGKTYYFVTMEGDSASVVAAFTLSNDGLKAALVNNTERNRIQRKIPNSKRMRSYPGMLIARLGVSQNYRNQHVGTQVINYIKTWITKPDNKSGCRFLLVDAYNKPEVIRFYERNGFQLLYGSEEREKEVYEIREDAPLRSRLMYYDLWYIVKDKPIPHDIS